MSLPASPRRTAPSDPEVDEDPAGLIGRVLADRYRVTGLLGVGGIGRVYRAEHIGLGREVALKVLLEHYQCVADLQKRFEREAMALAALSHPNIVTITDFVSTKQLTFLVMELVDGTDLDELMEEDGLATADAFSVMEQVLSSLAYAHARGVIHRDLKPQNVLVRELPAGKLHAVVLDFGLAKFMEPGTGKHANLTKTGFIVGTPAYMAPEQASGGRANERSDVYAAGIMFYEMLTGALPFDSDDQSDVIRQHLLRPAPRLADGAPGARIALDLEAFFARALSKDGSDRFADAGTMLAAFLALPRDAFVPAEDKPTRAERATSATAATHLAVPATPRRSGSGRNRRAVWLAALTGALVSAALTAIALFVLGPALFAPSTVNTEPAIVAAEEPIEQAEGTEAEALEADEAEVATADEADEEPEDEANDPSLDELADAPIEEEEEEEAAPPPVTRPRARNPWRGRTPATLALVERRVERGNPITKRHIRQVARYRQRHPSDVRSRLVLAHAYGARGWHSAAIEQYRRAYRRDPSSRGDRRMQRDLIRFLGASATHDAALAALLEIYGAEARAPLAAAIERESDRERRQRLATGLSRLTSPTAP